MTAQTDEPMGITGNLFGITIAVEFNGDGSVTICKEIVDDILKDVRVPADIKSIFDRKEFGNRFGKAVKI